MAFSLQPNATGFLAAKLNVIALGLMGKWASEVAPKRYTIYAFDVNGALIANYWRSIRWHYWGPPDLLFPEEFWVGRSPKIHFSVLQPNVDSPSPSVWPLWGSRIRPFQHFYHRSPDSPLSRSWGPAVTLPLSEPWPNMLRAVLPR